IRLLGIGMNAECRHLRAISQKLDFLVAAVGCNQIDDKLGERFDRMKWNCPLRWSAKARQHGATLFVLLADMVFESAYGFFVEDVEIDRWHDARQDSCILRVGPGLAPHDEHFGINAEKLLPPDEAWA